MEVIGTVNKSCETHGEYVSEIIRFGAGFDFESGCPICGAQHEERVKRYNEEQERDRVESARKRFLEDSNMEPMYHNATLDNFKTDTDEQKKAAAAIKRLIDGDVKKVLFIGSNGTGKTHLACAAIHALGVGRIMTMFEISATIRASFTKHDGPQELEILDGLASRQLLVIDEIGRTKGSDSEINWLSYIIDKRHARELRTIIISNNHLRKECKAGGCHNCIENYLAEDMISRLCENGLIVRFNGPDYRRQAK